MNKYCPLDSALRGILFFIIIFLIFIYLFGCAGSQLRRAGSSAEAYMWDLVPRPGIKPRPPTLGAWSLSTVPPGKSLRGILKTPWKVRQLRNALFFFFYWSMVDLQCCISFRRTAK